VNYKSNKGRQCGFLNNNNYHNNVSRKAIKTKVLGGNKMLVHPTGEPLFNKNHSILQFRKE